MANYWSLENGSYVGPDGTTSSGCSNPPHWNYCKYANRGNHPNGTFSAVEYGKGIGKAVTTVFDLNVFSLSPEDQLAQLDYLKAAGFAEKVEYLENVQLALQICRRLPQRDCPGLRARSKALPICQNRGGCAKEFGALE